MTLTELEPDALTQLLADQQAAYAELKARGLKLDLTRGKPSAEQLDLSNALLTLPGDGEFRDSSGTDCRNYGGIEGVADLRAIFGELLGVPVDQLIAGDNASLAIMHDVIVFALLKGVPGAAGPWAGEKIKFICPVPGYDRHFSICQQYGIEMINVDLGDEGPDLDQIRELVKDPAVKGIWTVPTYANPSGSIYTEEITRQLVSLETAAPDFRIFWDNAYALHHLTETETPVLDVLGLAEAAGHPDRVLIFASTSKITFAGAGVSFFASSPANVAWYLGLLGKRTIGPNKINQLAHARYLGSAAGVRALMAQHRAIIAPKFDRVEQILADRLGAYGVASWTEPQGGYFVSLDVTDGTASRVVQLAKEAGIVMTGAGSAFPYGKDPRDRNIRIAPTFPTPEDVELAIDGLATCVLLAAAEQRLAG
ncbi:aminotransferase class I/II-fold pyridoxal phosphate-dependent enzyme [Microlunatus speluncae]|uniref:aminotransferase class I/II-fold pyridoxal phosphate-dependent enzyme n=1 Tax=Microlunatus speluncae TaxID=2594267 RepID=UPI001266294E|nr:aminotransferase class I/II-fold pyridoxal phosphate-dependent enzyme [Microlunatus speluncae]